jgi:hypothetical protein
LVDLIFLVGEGTSHIPVLNLAGSNGVVGGSDGGVSGIENVVGVDDLSWDHLFTCSNDVGVGNG